MFIPEYYASIFFLGKKKVIMVITLYSYLLLNQFGYFFVSCLEQ